MCPLKGGSFPCPQTWTFYKSNCYYRSSTSLTWQNARDSCRRTANADLVYIESASENAFVVKFAAGIHLLWFGYNDIDVEGNFVWSKANVSSSYTNWKPTEPNSHGGNEDCGDLLLNESLPGLWNDRPCHTVLPFACKMPGTGMIYVFESINFQTCFVEACAYRSACYT